MKCARAAPAVQLLTFGCGLTTTAKCTAEPTARTANGRHFGDSAQATTGAREEERAEGDCERAPWPLC